MKDQLAGVRGQRVHIKEQPVGDCTRCAVMDKMGEYAWVIEVLTTKAGLTGADLSELFRQARAAISSTI
jgi:hypothetical protein